METYEEKYKDLVKRLNKARVKKGVYTFNSVLDAIAPELKIEESEDERIRKEIISLIKGIYQGSTTDSAKSERDKYVAWLEKQGEHVKFLNSIQVGDQVTRNEDGGLFNLSQLKRVAKPAENKGKNNMGISEATKQKLEDNLNKALEKETPESWNKFLDDQKSVDKVEPKQGWGEEDEVMTKVFESIIRYIAEVVDKDALQRFGTNSEELFSWFKSLKDRYTWKPSDEQMDVLVWCKPLFVDPKLKGIIDSLINDLKKLREE